MRAIQYRGILDYITNAMTRKLHPWDDIIKVCSIYTWRLSAALVRTVNKNYTTGRWQNIILPNSEEFCEWVN